MVDDGNIPTRKTGNDNRPPDGRNDGHAVDASERLDRVVLTIARLIGTQIAREHFATLQAAMTTGRHFAMGPDRMRVMRIDQEVRASSIFPVGGSAGHVLSLGATLTSYGMSPYCLP
ncbi:hypothetical protein H2136_18745 [Aeromonas hydrophila]|uniref:Uncharacterized protein n=1 Tax=Aeromonas hydrophila TaxID=644 RepID=A0A926IZ47_AERHY|nr:hypothetical protein [Aeromonas hydrophila]